MTTTVTVIGTGSIGSAVAHLATKAGAAVQLLGRDQDKAAAVAAQVGATAGAVGDAITGEIVVLAVPYPALAELAATYGPQLDGRIVVETTNPLDFATFDALVVPADSSATAELAAAAPGARVLKAFNTNFAATLAAGTVDGAPTTVLVAGDDESARDSLIALVEAAGLRGLAVGGLKRARELEAIGFTQLVLAVQEKLAWTGAIAPRG
ncbi:NADPH-dependent F420 reductase [Demequina gelatinilytica]|uniref:NADPH-dependent F420 reductase n=1 Tax=Demequina gelatinilytica TaxID=1638980 RepID=UPI00078481E4|nr:NAD(P)-binding domain-containing protein [Demequina gelatinilytica]